MASNDSDVSKLLPSTSAMLSTSTGSSASTMLRLKFDKHSTCVKCRGKQCSVEIRCSECESWSVDFILFSRNALSLLLVFLLGTFC